MANDSYLFLTKPKLQKLLNCTMAVAYRKGVFTNDIVKQLGFQSLKEFKNAKNFNIEQSKKVRNYLEQLRQS